MNTKCLICDSLKYNVYCSIEEGKYKVKICEKCTFTQLSPLPSEDELNQFYAKTYRKEYSKQDTVDNEVLENEQQRADRVISFIEDSFDKSYSKILDIGCSSGTLLKNVATLSEKPILYGIEMNDNYRNYILNKGIVEEENISNDDINNYYKKRENTIDFISIVHVLEHLRKPNQTLESIYKLLKTDGMLYIEVPNLKTPYNNLRKKYFAIYHLYYFTDITLRLLLEQVGFTIIEEKVMANTSISFICKKKNIKNIKNNNLKNEYEKVITLLKKYEFRYLLLFPRRTLIKVLELLKLKEYIKKSIQKV